MAIVPCDSDMAARVLRRGVGRPRRNARWELRRWCWAGPRCDPPHLIKLLDSLDESAARHGTLEESAVCLPFYKAETIPTKIK